MTRCSPTRNARYPSLKSRLASVSYLWRATAENIAEGQAGAAEVVASWMGSSAHRANIMGAAYTEIGAFFKRSHKIIIPLTVREILDEQIAHKLA